MENAGYENPGMMIFREPDDNLNDRFYHNHSNVSGCRKYHNDLVKEIQTIYIILAIIWVVIIYLVGIYRKADFVILGLMLIPFIVFAVSFYYATEIGDELEDYMSNANYLSFGFLVAVILLNWGSKEHGKSDFFKYLVLGFILIVISTIDVWVSRERLSLMRHLESGLQTIALVVLALALYRYWLVQGGRENIKDTPKNLDGEIQKL